MLRLPPNGGVAAVAVLAASRARAGLVNASGGVTNWPEGAAVDNNARGSSRSTVMPLYPRPEARLDERPDDRVIPTPKTPGIKKGRPRGEGANEGTRRLSAVNLKTRLRWNLFFAVESDEFLLLYIAPLCILRP